MITMSQAQMDEVLQRSMQVLRSIYTLWGLDLPVVPGPPATTQSLNRLAAAVPFPLPPSYVQLLRIADGITNFYRLWGKIIPCTYRLEHPRFAEDWERPDLFFFIEGTEGNAVAFDPATRNAEGEMAVLEIDNYLDADRWPSLNDFLVGYKERLEGWLADEQADRAKVDDD